MWGAYLEGPQEVPEVSVDPGLGVHAGRAGCGQGQDGQFTLRRAAWDRAWTPAGVVYSDWRETEASSPTPPLRDTHSHLCLAQRQATATSNGAGEGQLERVGRMDSADRPDAGGVGFGGAGAGGQLGGCTTPEGSRAGQQRVASVHGLRPVSRPSAWFVHMTSEAFGP